jgi:hypothetical protein
MAFAAFANSGNRANPILKAAGSIKLNVAETAQMLTRDRAAAR